MFIGIDLGTSSLKAIVLDRAHRVRASATVPLTLQQPQRLWREQDPAQWWAACQQALEAALAQASADGISAASIEAIGLTGQMHGATLLDARGEVLRPAMLWNDGRAHHECAELERRVPTSRQITGNLMMPGFTAPKLLWLAQHEPDLFKRIDKVLLPKDYLRWCLSGDFASDMSDAAGTMWLDVARRAWSDDMLQATGLTRAHMPGLHEGPQLTGRLRADVAQRLGLQQVPLVAGAGDNAAGALGAGVVHAGEAMLSLGTSGVYFVATDGYLANPAQAVHSFCHALPDTWHLMSVMLSAAACLDFTARLSGEADIGKLLAEAQARGLDDATPLFLPYLNGERTPHNNPAAQAVFFGMGAGTERADLVNATLEGVAHALTQGIDALESSGVVAHSISLIGGGSRSPYWAQMISDLSGKTLQRRAEGDVGPSLGAARLARMAIDQASAAQVCPTPPLLALHEPDPRRRGWFDARRRRFAALYTQLESSFPAAI